MEEGLGINCSMEGVTLIMNLKNMPACLDPSCTAEDFLSSHQMAMEEFETLAEQQGMQCTTGAASSASGRSALASLLLAGIVSTFLLS